MIDFGQNHFTGFVLHGRVTACLLVTVGFLIQVGLHSSAAQSNYLENLMKSRPEQFSRILDHPDKYRVQIIYTRIDRKKNQEPVFRDYTYRLDEQEYFYPASVVKMPAAFLALEKLKEKNIPGLNKYSPLRIDSAFSGQSAVRYDSTSATGFPSVAHYIRKTFLVSDNDAFNRLYEFLGQGYLNAKLQEKGFTGSRINHRLSIELSEKENRCTNPFAFFDNNGQEIFRQPLTCHEEALIQFPPAMLGRGFLQKDSLIQRPKDFTHSNHVPLMDLHRMLKRVIFPLSSHPGIRFNLTEDDYRFLYRCMSELPGESADPYYGDHYPDNYVKFLMFGAYDGKIPENIRIFNKVGLAYGFLIDAAYIVDFTRQIEFMLSAVIYVNEDGIFNDDQYEYDSIGFPFMQHLGELIYDQELFRKRKIQPDLSKFRINYD